jgi:uncharacterized membrane protein YfcA
MIEAVVLGVLIGVALGALGGGASILAVPVLVHLAGQDAEAATATSLVAVGAASAVASVGHARGKRVDWPAAVAFVLLGVPGTWLGSLLNARLDHSVLLLAFSALVLVAALRMLLGCPTCTNVGEERALRMPSFRRSLPPGSIAAYAKVLVAASLVGVLTGLFGVGGGFVIVPALALALLMSMPRAIGTALVIIVGNAVVALAFRGFDAVDWHLSVPFAATMLVGSAFGAMFATRLPARRSVQLFAGLLIAVAVANGALVAWELWS